MSTTDHTTSTTDHTTSGPNLPISVYDVVSDSLVERYGVHIREESEDKARRFLAGLCMKFSGKEVLEAWDIATKRYDNPVTALSKLGGILYNRSIFNSFIEEI